ncbi:MAG: metallophosphoesterase family protein [Clostridiales bacterium]|nr:metallophosphoesterase family protein [Clostridiales bacterium]
MAFCLAFAPKIALFATWCYILGVLVTLGILMILFMVISAAMVRIDIQEIPIQKNSASASGASPANDRPHTVTIGFFSDTHGFGCLKSPRWIAGAFQKEKCDLVLFGGDCVYHRTVRSSDKKMLTEVSGLLQGTNTKLYAVFGNHDWQLSRSDYEKMGVILLSDSWETIKVRNTSFALCGMSDSERGERPWSSIPKDFSSFEGFRLLLVHNPDFLYTLLDASKESADHLPFDFMLAGHLHGGQVHLPGNLEFLLFREDRIAREEGILSGQFQLRGYQGFISKGAGNGFLPIRLMARPEIHILRFHFPV